MGARAQGSTVEDVVALARLGHDAACHRAHVEWIGLCGNEAAELEPVALAVGNVATSSDDDGSAMAPCDALELLGQERAQRPAVERGIGACEPGSRIAPEPRYTD